MIITGVKAGDYVQDMDSLDEIKIYKVNHIDSMVVAGRLEVRLWLEGKGFKETRTITSDEFVVMRIIGEIGENDYKIMTIVSRGHANTEIARERTAVIIANRRDQVGEDEVNTISLPAFDKKHPHLAPYKPGPNGVD